MGKCNKTCNLGLLGLIRSIQGCMIGKVESEAKEMGLNSTQMLIVYEVYENQNISLNGLCGKLEIPKSTVSRIVDELVKKGVLTREIPEENRRILKLRISEGFGAAASLGGLGKDFIGKLGSEKTDRIIAALEELKAALSDDDSEVKSKNDL